MRPAVRVNQLGYLAGGAAAGHAGDRCDRPLEFAVGGWRGRNALGQSYVTDYAPLASVATFLS